MWLSQPLRSGPYSCQPPEGLLALEFSTWEQSTSDDRHDQMSEDGDEEGDQGGEVRYGLQGFWICKRTVANRDFCASERLANIATMNYEQLVATGREAYTNHVPRLQRRS